MLLATFKSRIINNTNYLTQGLFLYEMNKLNIPIVTETQLLAIISFISLASSICILLDL